MRAVKIAVIVASIAALAGGLVLVDHVMSRPDRVAAAERHLLLGSVRDQVLRYQAEHRALPQTLEELVPRQLRADQLVEGSAPRFRYEPLARYIEEAQGPQVRGLFTRRMAPRRYDLPALSVTAETVERIPGSVAIKSDPTPPQDSVTTAVPPAEGPAAGGTPAVHAVRVPRSPKLRSPPPGSYVFEAEHFSETNYGWEVHEDPECAGGAYLHCKEGIANGPGQTRACVGNFYELHSRQDVTMLRYYFHIPRSGNYNVYGRMWTTDTHCSNFVAVAIDKGGPYIGGMGNTTPFIWAWSPLKENPVHIDAGDHYLHVFIHEDGLKIDQFAITPQIEVSGGSPFAANLVTGFDTAWQKESGPATHISFDLKSMVITEKDAEGAGPPRCNLVIRRLRAAKGSGKVRAVLQGAGADGADAVLCDGEIDLEKLPELSLLPLSFKDVDVAKLPRREYLLKAELRESERSTVRTQTPLMKPLVWEVLGPLEFLPIESEGPADAKRDVPQSRTAWKPFKEESWQNLGVLDFGLQANGNSLHAQQNCTVYARTKIKVPKTATYLLKIQSDDQMLLWLDGEEIFRHTDTQPVTRNASRVKRELTEGEHEIRMRVNQLTGRWQAMLRFRSAEDGLSPIVGVE